MNDAEYMRLAFGAGGTGPGLDGAQSHGGRRDRKDGAVIGQGWHERYGEPTRSENALASCTADPRRSHHVCDAGALLPPRKAAALRGCDPGIRHPPVVIGSADPNPLVAGKGVAILRSHGVEVTENVLRQECDALNKIFFHYITTGRPFVSMKYAMTMDGKIAAYTGVRQMGHR